MRIPSDLWSLPAIRSLAPRSGRHLACRGAGHPCPADSHGSLARSAAPAFDWFQAPLGAVRKPQLDATSRCRFMNMLIKGKPSKLALFVTDAANKMPAEMQHCLSGRSLTKTASEIRTEPDLDTLIRLSRLLVFEYATKMMTSLLSLDQPSLNPAKPSIQKNGHRVNGAHDRFLLPFLLGKKAGMRASDFGWAMGSSVTLAAQFSRCFMSIHPLSTIKSKTIALPRMTSTPQDQIPLASPRGGYSVPFYKHSTLSNSTRIFY